MKYQQIEMWMLFYASDEQNWVAVEACNRQREIGGREEGGKGPYKYRRYRTSGGGSSSSRSSHWEQFESIAGIEADKPTRYDMVHGERQNTFAGVEGAVGYYD